MIEWNVGNTYLFAAIVSCFMIIALYFYLNKKI
ncbi:MAG: hypothetical protein ACD_12C00086G0011 [uncultured bacterium]|nr:MAG: hypothetical protein ACD_12C00086G0011 [uncultured bacterium]